MLPSTGYFKAINCPFYENGYCERPYCHFKHSRRDQILFQKDGASTSSLVTSESSQTVQKPQNTSITSVTSANSNVIEQLVSEAVKKVLADQNVTDTENIVNKVVEGLKPNLVSSVLSTAQSSLQNVNSSESVSSSLNEPTVTSSKSSHYLYNPTPITALKRHIPIAPYELQRESKAVKRKSPESDKPWMDVIRNIPSVKESRSHKVRYKPTAISQTNAEKENPHHERSHGYGHSHSRSHRHGHRHHRSHSPDYGPAYANDDDSYIPEKRKKKKEFYQPKQKKRREEYVPRKPKVPLKLDQSFEDDTFDLDDDINDGSEFIRNATVEDELQNMMEIETKSYDDNDDLAIISETKDDEIVIDINNQVPCEEKESKRQDSDSNRNKGKSYRIEEPVKSQEDGESNSQTSEESSKEESRFNKDSKSSSRVKDESKEDSRSSKSKEDDSKYNKSKDDFKNNKKDDSKYCKSEDKDKGDEKKDKDQGNAKKEKDKKKEKSKEKDNKHKHSSKSSDKERMSSSFNSKDKEKNKDKDKEKKDSKNGKDSSSHKSKKDLKSDKDRTSNLKDSTERRDSKDREKSKHKSDERSSHKSKSSSSDSKSKSNKLSHKSSDSYSSHSSHKSDKSSEKTSAERDISEKEDSSSDINDDKFDQERKFDSPEYEEFSPMYDENLLEGSDSDHDVEAECRKIFQEYEVSDHPKDVTSKAPPKPEVEEVEEDTSKKRIAHTGADTSITKPVGPSQPLKKLPNPQQRMYERWRMMKEIAAEKAAEKATASKSDHQVNGNGRIRIAQVSYAQSLMEEKKKVLAQAAKAAPKTVAQTKKTGITRVAHVPQTVPQLVRPEPLQTSSTQKFPLNVRQFYVNAMQDICSHIYTNSEDAAQRAVREEFSCYERCKALNVYKNSCMLTVHRLRKEVDQKSEEVSGTGSGSISHEAVLAGKVKGSYSVLKPKKILTNFKGASLYNMAARWILSEQELKDNGYPRPHPDGPKGRAKLYITNARGQSTPSKVPNQRNCCRCNKSYFIDKHGFPIRKENCIYHYAKKYTFRGESKYMCCKQDGSSDGCCDASCHVWDFIDVENLRGYVSTLSKDSVSAEEQGIYSLDCEMCYTTQGLELTRITIINENLEVVYETLVKPTHPIIDYNTRFSGISESDMKNVTTTLLDVQATLLTMFSSKTILIGHSLESDFKALKLLHNTVVDTSVMFPHKNGPPFKRALKNLCSEYLRKIIQNDVGGHDSKEDAIACMELVLWKVKEEAKLQ